MTEAIADIIGEYPTFAAQQRDRLKARGIDVTPFELSHLAYRVPEWDEYVRVRGLLERHAIANHESVWNGRPISLIVLAEPLDVLDGKLVTLIELIPPCTSACTRWAWSTSVWWSAKHSMRSSMPTSRS
jgi:predicted metalloenzyme YecM